MGSTVSCYASASDCSEARNLIFPHRLTTTYVSQARLSSNLLGRGNVVHLWEKAGPPRQYVAERHSAIFKEASIAAYLPEYCIGLLASSHVRMGPRCTCVGAANQTVACCATPQDRIPRQHLCRLPLDTAGVVIEDIRVFEACSYA